MDEYKLQFDLRIIQCQEVLNLINIKKFKDISELKKFYKNEIKQIEKERQQCYKEYGKSD